MPRSIIAFMLRLLFLGSPALLLAGCDGGDRAQLLLEAKGEASDEALERTRAIVERRIGELGSSGATVVRQPPNRLLVTLPRAGDAAQVKALVGRSGRLDFRLVDTSVTPLEIDAGAVPPGTQILPYSNQGPGPDGRVPVRSRPILNGSMVVDARPGFDAAGNATVTVRFDAVGSRRLARATRDNVGRPFAIVLDDQVISAPAINEPITGGQAQIGGNFTVESANQLAIALRSGALPVDLVVVGERLLKR